MRGSMAIRLRPRTNLVHPPPTPTPATHPKHTLSLAEAFTIHGLSGQNATLLSKTSTFTSPTFRATISPPLPPPPLPPVPRPPTGRCSTSPCSSVLFPLPMVPTMTERPRPISALTCSRQGSPAAIVRMGTAGAESGARACARHGSPNGSERESGRKGVAENLARAGYL